MVCGLSAALSVIVSEAVHDPIAVGVNLTRMVQLEPAASVAPHVCVSEKSVLSVPVIAMLVMFNTALPVLESVTFWLPLVVPTFRAAKVMLVRDRLTTGAPPVPVRLMVCGLPAALSVMLTEAVRVPVAVGVNVTEIVQLALAASEAPQVLVCA